MYGFPTASEIASSVKLKRTNIYSILDSLIKKGLIVELKSGKVKQFRAVSVSRLYDYVEKQKLKLENGTRKLDGILDQIKEQVNISRHANVEFYNGFEEVSKFYIEQSKLAGKIDFRKITKFERYALFGNVIDQSNDICEKNLAKLGNKYIPEKTIVPDTRSSRNIISYQTSKHPDYLKFHDFKLVDFQNIPVDSQVIISPNDVVFKSVTEEESWAVRFFDKSMINTFSAVFEALWNKGKIYTP